MKKCGKNRVAAAVLILALMLQMVGISGPGLCSAGGRLLTVRPKTRPSPRRRSSTPSAGTWGGSYYLTCDIIFTGRLRPGGAFYNEGEASSPSAIKRPIHRRFRRQRL